MVGSANKFRHLNRDSAHRQALLRNLVTSLFQHESITTTWPKAKEAQRLAEKLITLGKKNTETSRRNALSVFYVCLEKLKFFIYVYILCADLRLTATMIYRLPMKSSPSCSALFVSVMPSVQAVIHGYCESSPRNQTKLPAPFLNSSTDPRICDSP